MEGKNSPLKFALLALAVVLAVALVVALIVGVWDTKDISEIIDQRGGHSLTYEIYTNQDMVHKHQVDLKNLNDELARTADEAAKKRLSEAISTIEAEIAKLEMNYDEDLPQRMIEILKRRVDLDRPHNIEWMLIGNNHFTVRMPAASSEAREALREYDEAVQELEVGNVSRSQINEIESTSGADRARSIEKIAANDADLVLRLKALGRASDALKAAGDKRAARLNSLGAWKKARKNVEAYNITRSQIEGIFRNYVSPEQFKKLTARDKKEVTKRMQAFEAARTKLLEGHKTRRDQIENVFKKYQTWANVRQFLDDPADLKRLIAKAGVLEFRVALQEPGRGKGFRPLSQHEMDVYRRNLQDEGPEPGRKRNDPYQWFVLRSNTTRLGDLIIEEYLGRDYVLLCNQPQNVMLQKRDWSLTSAKPTLDSFNTPVVSFEFDKRGSSKFGTLTSAHIGHSLATLLDDEVYTAPTIQNTITSNGIITGKFTSAEVMELVRTLEGGALPARLNPEPVSVIKFGPISVKENQSSEK